MTAKVTSATQVFAPPNFRTALNATDIALRLTRQ
jgi:hypothetical protein